MNLLRRLLLSAPLLPLAAQAQEAWPARGTIRFVVPGPAGGAGDVTARLVMERLAARLGQQIVVENRPGAGTNIGMTLVARAAPDGYVLGLASIASHAVNRSLYRNLPFDPVADFAPVSLLALVPNMMVVPPGLPVSNLAEFVAFARARPGQINFGSVGAGSSQHLAGAQFAQATGIELQHIPYNAGGQMNTDLMEGRIQVLFQSVSAVAELARAGRVRPLAVTGTERIAAFPEVPTLREGGVDIVSTGWFGVVAPAQTPAAILDRLHAETIAALAEPELAARLAAGGSLPRASASRADFARFMAEETARWAPVVRATGATAD
ncbi:Bug family tripartite tricarboxylate transporter substrate binding protein [Sediminicoccus rosea]|uniref:Tripartite tricarboxylate transporter substrate binding protein n=1 Tax=Sediminicoccus rosea TaxID=1225128 RepID=A0ABZ0PGP7_9PROT|nr:tripartite tricarboxylate transporter substrate binding protein [Sediminicoccus rosea]WPB84782.1 tripartite tricarboxylate transporter substrate binding protein [Sediminicoccus rosea]